MSGNACPDCGRAYEWQTDGPFGIGTIRPVHPVGKCEPPKPVEYEPDYDEMGECPQCKRVFVKAMLKQRFCSDSCKAKRQKYDREYKRQGRKPDTRVCRYCFDTFESLIRTQTICGSRECKKAYQREYHQRRNAA